MFPIYDGEYFEICRRDNDLLFVRCIMCGPDALQLRSSAKSNGNILKHIKRRHPELMDVIRAKKNIKSRGAHNNHARLREPKLELEVEEVSPAKSQASAGDCGDEQQQQQPDESNSYNQPQEEQQQQQQQQQQPSSSMYLDCGSGGGTEIAANVAVVVGSSSSSTNSTTSPTSTSGADPLPAADGGCKYIATSSTSSGAPQFVITATNANQIVCKPETSTGAFAIPQHTTPPTLRRLVTLPASGSGIKYVAYRTSPGQQQQQQQQQPTTTATARPAVTIVRKREPPSDDEDDRSHSQQQLPAKMTRHSHPAVVVGGGASLSLLSIEQDDGGRNCEQESQQQQQHHQQQHLVDVDDAEVDDDGDECHDVELMEEIDELAPQQHLEVEEALYNAANAGGIDEDLMRFRKPHRLSTHSNGHLPEDGHPEIVELRKRLMVREFAMRRQRHQLQMDGMRREADYRREEHEKRMQYWELKMREQ